MFVSKKQEHGSQKKKKKKKKNDRLIFIKNNVFQLSNSTKNIHQGKLYQ